ncbi:ATP-binding protein [Streptomyces sp. NPDC088725]|uniref:ATP-binding protein n=1 Tax=Streptomyces sp. NPDC088725 TaxID=3365873 RepID=UPI0037FDD70B
MDTTRERTGVDLRMPVFFHSTPSAVGEARGIARAFLGRFAAGIDAAPADAVVVVVSELVANAVRHAGGAGCSLWLSARPGSITVEVSDSSPVTPRERVPDLTGRTGGYGWPTVRRLARSVSVIPATGGKTGKTVRAVISR